MLRRMTMTSLRRVSANKANKTSKAQAFRVLSTSSSSILTIPKPWGTATGFVESAGDYRDEAWLEDHVGGPLYQYQHQLPRLPIPDVKQTMERLLPTTLPLATSPQEAQGLQQACQVFPQQATVLQERLLARGIQHGKNSSWLQHWWNTLGYLHVRDSIVINVSYYFHFADDTTVLASSSTSSSSPQIKRAAALLYTTAQVRNQVVTGTWPPEVLGRGDKAKPLCSTAYKYMFHACRIPGAPADSYRIYDPALHTHAAVAIRGQFYKIPLVDTVTHAPVPLHVLEASLEQAMEQANDNNTTMTSSGLSWCTTQDRDAWAAARQTLDTATLQQLQMLESAACLVCLDEQAVHTTRAMAHVLLHGNAVVTADNKNSPPLNRWFDKSLQYIVTTNGKAGLVGEHSMMDGMPVVTLADKLATTSYADVVQASAQADVTTVTPYATPILEPTTSFSRETQEHILQARQAYQEWIGKHEIHPKRFGMYGSDWIKKQAGMSPDAFVQMAMQVATYRLWDGVQGGTYEATQVRPFLHGRTETTRSVSPDSAALVQRMGTQPLWHEVGDAQARQEKLELLRAAADTHVKYIKWAADAQGVDRHLLGLLLTVGENETAPDLYADPVYQRAKTWRVSTSNLSHPRFVNWGYGEVTPMGVGLSYSIHPHHLQFSVTALKEHEWTERLGQHLEEALVEFQMLVEANNTQAAPQSKL